MNEFSFMMGYNQVQRKDCIQVRTEIMQALNITTTQGWRDRLFGRVEPRVSEARVIEVIFAKYGVTDIWGAE
jgi:hypothetical protein